MPRRYVNDGDFFMLSPGDYGFHPRTGDWYVRPPVEGHHLVGNLANHKVIEHDDGTITVSPSILITGHDDSGREVKWHGYLERGQWREV